MTIFARTIAFFNAAKHCNFPNVCNVTVQRIRFVSTALPQKKFKTVTTSKEDIQQFNETFPSIVSDLINHEKFGNISEVMTRLKRSLNYNVPKGKKNRGLTVVESYKILQKPECVTPEEFKSAFILGWLVEMLQAFFIVMDDLTDGSETRRGQLCWYKLEDIGSTAINDGLILENSIYILLKQHFSNHDSYVQFMELFHDATTKTIMGQILDCNTLDVNRLTKERYELIALNKTAYYSFYLPVALALYLSNYIDPKAHVQAKEILLQIGTFFQIQDDFLDCFGDPNVTGKIGTDIETAKCTWLAVTAMQLASANQKAIMEEHYGKQDPGSVKKIKDLYIELNIPGLFKEYEQKSYEQIQSKIAAASMDLPHELFAKIIAKIYKRIS